MQAAASRPGAMSLRRDCGPLLLRTCQLFSGQRPRGLSRQEVARSSLRKAPCQQRVCWGPHLRRAQGTADGFFEHGTRPQGLGT